MVRMEEDVRKRDTRANGGIPVTPRPRPQRTHPGPHGPRGSLGLYLGKCPYRAVRNFNSEVMLALGS